MKLKPHAGPFATIQPLDLVACPAHPTIDPQANQVTVQTQDAYRPFFNHWIQANYEPNSGKVNHETITGWVSWQTCRHRPPAKAAAYQARKGRQLLAHQWNEDRVITE